MCILKLERTIHRHVHIYARTLAHTHAHIENNGWKKSVKATSSDSQGNTTTSVKENHKKRKLLYSLG